MNYVLADLHGHAKEFKEMLELIKFSDKDTLYILGDVIDRGNDPLECLKIISMHENMIPILGNHEFMALQCLPELLKEIKEENIYSTLNVSFMNKLNVWIRNGGQTTINDFHKLNREDQNFYLEMMEDFSLYEEIDVKGCKYYLTHTLPENFSVNKEYTIEEYLFSRPDFSATVAMESIIVMGHTPTLLIDSRFKGKIYKKNNMIDIDCGCAGNLVLGCLCLETMKEFYVACK